MQGRASNFANVLSLLGAFVATAMVMGLLAAGLLIPAVGATGSAAKSGVDLFDSLPGEFTSSPLSQVSRILDKNGGLIATPYDENRILINLNQVAPIMKTAQLAIEDSRFYEHGGVDVRGVSRALISNAKGNGTQGASTLTQQYVKITLQETALRNNDQEAADAAVSQTYTRKLQELKYAITLEKNLSKDKIFEGYLNLVYYGDQAYGVEAAAQHYFSIHASQLNLVQSALLAGTVQNPGRTDPINSPEKALVRRNVVLDRMYELGQISTKDWTAAKKVTIKSMLKPKASQKSCAASTQPYFCEYVLAWLKQQPALGKSIPERIKNINQGGLTIQTTLDPQLTADTIRLLRAKVPASEKKFGAASTIIEPGTGKILAMAQTSNFAQNQVNWNVEQRYGGTLGFAFGSTAKMFAVVRALQSGIPVNGSVYAKYASTTQAATYTRAENTDSCGVYAPWQVRNDESIGGKNIPFKKAVASSVNTAFASLVMKLGPCSVRDTMTKMGLHQGNMQPMSKFPSGITLGSDSTPVMTLANSYATLAAGGKFCQPVPVLSITTPDKKQLKLPGPQCKQVIEPEIAAGATELLTGVIKNGTGTGAKLSGSRPAAGKTGTTEDHGESWFVGYTPQRAAAVWVGTPLGETHMNSVRIGGTFYPRVFGGTIAAPLWAQIMNRASTDLPVRDFPTPSDKVNNGDFVDLPSVSGLSVSEATAALKQAGFDAKVAGSTNSTLRRGLVVYSTPSSRALRGATIDLYTSTGFVPRVVPRPQPKPSATATKPVATTPVVPPPSNKVSKKPKPKITLPTRP